MKSMWYAVAAAVALVSSSGVVRAQNPPPAPPPQEEKAIIPKVVERKNFEQKLPLDDDFLIAAFASFNAQSQYASLAGKHTEGENKAFADTVMREHEQGKKAIADLVKDRKIALVAGTERPVRDRLAALRKAEQPAFVHEYHKAFLDENKRQLQIFEHQAKQGQDQSIKAFAEKMLPRLREQRKQAEKLHAAGTTTGTAPAPATPPAAEKP